MPRLRILTYVYAQVKSHRFKRMENLLHHQICQKGVRKRGRTIEREKIFPSRGAASQEVWSEADDDVDVPEQYLFK